MSAPLIGSAWQEELKSLKKGWDSYNGHSISHQAIRVVEELAVVPRSAGGLQLEIHRDGFDIEIMISPKGKIESVLVCSEKVLT